MTYKDKDLVEYLQSKKTYDAQAGKLEKRVQELVDLVLKTCNVKLSWWAYKYYEDSDMDPPLPDLKESYTDFEEEFPWFICTQGSRDALATDEWDYGDGFPIKFLFMNDNDIVKMITRQIKETKDAKAEKKQKQKVYLQKKKQFAALMAAEEKKIKKKLGIK